MNTPGQFDCSSEGNEIICCPSSNRELLCYSLRVLRSPKKRDDIFSHGIIKKEKLNNVETILNSC